MSFVEFYERYPKWHIAYLHGKYPANSNADFDDVAQYLLLRTIEMQRVEQYDPAQFGLHDSIKLFRNWMNTCWRRDLATVLAARTTGKRLANKNTISLDGESHNGRKVSIDALLLEGIEKWNLKGSSAYVRKAKQEGDRPYNTVWLNQFRAFVAKHRPDMLSILDAMDSGDIEASRQNWHLQQLKIRTLAKHFEAGTIPGRSVWVKEEKRKRREGEKEER